MYPDFINATTTKTAFGSFTQYQLQVGTDPVTYTQVLSYSFGIGIIVGLLIFLLLEAIDYFRES